MNREFTAPGLTGSWINAWLAAIGITILVPEARLRWDGHHQPVAVFDHADLVDRLVAALPSQDDLDSLAIAKSSSSCVFDFPRNPTIDAYRERSELARTRGDFSLWCTVTDFVGPDDERLAHSPFDPSAPQGITIHERLKACRQAIDNPHAMIEDSLHGIGKRLQMNGLGFDYRRIMQSTIPGQAPFADPVIELLAFFGLALIPARGDQRRSVTRGWTGGATRRGSFTWPVWKPALGVAAIDALLDRHWAGHATPTEATYEVVPYQQRGQMDATRGFASRRLP